VSRLGVTAEDQDPAIGGGKLYVEHLDGGKLIEHRTRSQPTRHRLKLRACRGSDITIDSAEKVFCQK